MRSCPVADDDDLPPQSLPAGLGDQTAAAKALIVRMRRDYDEWSIFERLTHRPNREPISGIKKFVDGHRHRSGALTGWGKSVRGVRQCTVRAGLAEIGREVS